MTKKFSGLQALLEEEKDAREYYSSLPSYVRSMIDDRAGNVNSIESLRDYAENLLRGDD